jgi:hypothetical protein
MDNSHDEEGALSWVELADIMAEPPGGDSGGRRATNLTPTTEHDEDHDPVGAHPPRLRARLSVRASIHREFIRGGGAHVHFAGATGEPNGRPRTWPYGVTVSVVEAIVRRVGCEPETFARLVRQGPKSAADRRARARLARAIAEVMEDGRGQGIEEALTATYGCSRGALHRLRREAAEKGGASSAGVQGPPGAV